MDLAVGSTRNEPLASNKDCEYSVGIVGPTTYKHTCGYSRRSSHNLDRLPQTTSGISCLPVDDHLQSRYSLERT